MAELLWQSGRPIVLAALVANGYPSPGRQVDKLLADGEAAISCLAVALGAAPINAPLHERLMRGWSLLASAAEPLRRALVLLSDHELNASTFAVRVAASTGAPIAACMVAGLSALIGPRHGGEVRQQSPCSTMRACEAPISRSDRPFLRSATCLASGTSFIRPVIRERWRCSMPCRPIPLSTSSAKG